MSGIYIHGMKMPTRCIACQMNYDSCACILTGSRFYKYNTEFDPGKERLPDCPLITVPDHGRLIDADALPKYTGYALSAGEVAMAVEDAPTIIPADPPVMYYPQVDGITPTIIPADKEGEG